MTEEKRGIRFTAAVAVCLVAIGGVLAACEMAEVLDAETPAAGLAGLSARPAHVEVLRSLGGSAEDSIELPALAPAEELWIIATPGPSTDDPMRMEESARNPDTRRVVDRGGVVVAVPTFVSCNPQPLAGSRLRADAKDSICRCTRFGGAGLCRRSRCVGVDRLRC